MLKRSAVQSGIARQGSRHTRSTDCNRTTRFVRSVTHAYANEHAAVSADAQAVSHVVPPHHSSQPQLVASVAVQPAAAAASTAAANRWTSSTSVMLFAIVLQAAALVGACVTGVLARKRRKELEVINDKLREVNAEFRRVRSAADDIPLICEADPDQEAMRAYRNALENALQSPAAAHPVEGYGPGKNSLATSRRMLSKCMREAKKALSNDDGADALLHLRTGLDIADDIADKRALRAIVRTQAQAYRKMGDAPAALSALQRCMELSTELADVSGDADVLGEIADVYVDLGDLERAAEYYDKCIHSIQEESPSSLTSSWDC